MFFCKNHRANIDRLSFFGSSPKDSVVLADLYYDEACTKFYRTAAVADCGHVNSAIAYAENANEIAEEKIKKAIDKLNQSANVEAQSNQTKGE